MSCHAKINSRIPQRETNSRVTSINDNWCQKFWRLFVRARVDFTCDTRPHVIFRVHKDRSGKRKRGTKTLYTRENEREGEKTHARNPSTHDQCRSHISTYQRRSRLHLHTLSHNTQYRDEHARPIYSTAFVLHGLSPRQPVPRHTIVFRSQTFRSRSYLAISRKKKRDSACHFPSQVPSPRTRFSARGKGHPERRKTAALWARCFDSFDAGDTVIPCPWISAARRNAPSREVAPYVRQVCFLSDTRVSTWKIPTCVERGKEKEIHRLGRKKTPFVSRRKTWRERIFAGKQ